MRAKIKQYAGPANVMCLEALSQPLVSEMQTCIRYQNRQLERAGDAIAHALGQIGSNERVAREIGVCTETFDRLTSALADIQDKPVEEVRESVLPGSAAFHRKRKGAA